MQKLPENEAQMSIHIAWWNAWRSHIKNAKAYPDQAGGYCRAAMIAQMEYVMYSALYWAEVRIKP